MVWQITGLLGFEPAPYFVKKVVTDMLRSNVKCNGQELELQLDSITVAGSDLWQLIRTVGDHSRAPVAGCRSS
jgi:hypothetical protein